MFFKKHFPCITLEEYKCYYSNKTEHPFLNEGRTNITLPYTQKFDINDMLFTLEESKEEIYTILHKLLFLSNPRITQQHAKDHENLDNDFFGKMPNYSNVSSKKIPSPTMLFYCASSLHPLEDKRFKKSSTFVFSPNKYCEICCKSMDSSNYILIFNLRQQLHLKLCSLPSSVIDLLISNNLKERNSSKEGFSKESLVNDVSDGLLNKILIENGFYDSCDILLTGMLNTDGVDLKRKSNNYRSVYGIWMALSTSN